MRSILQTISQSMPPLTIASVVDILLVAFLVYQFLMIVQAGVPRISWPES